MEICQHCGKEVERICIVSYFIPGRDAQNVHNTQEVARLCNQCTMLLMSNTISVPKPDNALSLWDMII